MNGLYVNKAREALFFSVLISVVIFFLSLFFLSYYINGDQSHYIKFWNDSSTLNFFDIYSIQATSLGSREPIYALLVYLFSGWAPKNLIVASANALIALLVSRWMFKNNVNLMVIIFLFGIFYFWVIFLAAERLKFAFLFLLLATVSFRNSFLLVGVALMTHVSVIIPIIARYANEILGVVYDLVVKYRIEKYRLLYFSISLLGVSLIGAALSTHIYHKLVYVFQDFSFNYVGIIKGFIFWSLALIYCKGKYRQVMTAGLSLMIPVLVLGPDRTIIFYYIFFMYYALQYKRGVNLGVIVTILYFSSGTIDFIENVINYGDGFYFSEKAQKEASIN